MKNDTKIVFCFALFGHFIPTDNSKYSIYGSYFCFFNNISLFLCDHFVKKI
ncbi:hypothetical protein HMPREF0083_04844 [Aneurinibacillus aneurinilyticus ATCC 12856]|uniref:Uncharacterized protein n=1 Tax=Aneurinibacillus aneurinilyticus ATCC 12856 TaxID=649747 RepID=U1WER6_ANEAE|nr:hypothetical protein HMPREF0083_04844 [Aneurinibacillus aneurinilyticus ATCC 12856]